MPARHTFFRGAYEDRKPAPATETRSILKRQHVFRFYFPKMLSSHTVHAWTLVDAIAELAEFVSHCGPYASFFDSPTLSIDGVEMSYADPADVAKAA